MRAIILSLSVVLAGCAGSTVSTDDAPIERALWTYVSVGEDLRDRSCPDRIKFQTADALTLHAHEIDRGPEDARMKDISGLEIAGAWHLTSEESEFGGLSGLDVLDSGSLLAVTDDGKFVWIGIDPATGAPDGLGALAYMRDQDGDIFARKRDGDAEDLAVRDGLAFVSFEQDHRIQVYDLEGCGAAAHGALLMKIDRVVDGNTLENNRGAEALSFAGDQLVVGFETRNLDGSPIGTLNEDGTLTDVGRTNQPQLHLLTGMDRVNDITATLFRAYDPVRGARGYVQVEDADGPIAEARFRGDLPRDNFEGIAIGQNPSGGVRIWVISDDNFSDDQRTLLLALDLTE
ncbi:MAG: esterase-like activity of phytase family protein [Pseudomonadota bacterium]